MSYPVNKDYFTAEQEVNYLSVYINQYRKHFAGIAQIELHTEIAPCNHPMKHDLLLPVIDDAFRFGTFRVQDPAIVFSLQLNETCLTFSVEYVFNSAIHDERTRVTFLRFKNQLEADYPGKHVLYRNYHLDTYLVILQLQLV